MRPPKPLLRLPTEENLSSALPPDVLLGPLSGVGAKPAHADVAGLLALTNNNPAQEPADDPSTAISTRPCAGPPRNVFGTDSSAFFAVILRFFSPGGCAPMPEGTCKPPSPFSESLCDLSPPSTRSPVSRSCWRVTTSFARASTCSCVGKRLCILWKLVSHNCFGAVAHSNVSGA